MLKLKLRKQEKDFATTWGIMVTMAAMDTMEKIIVIMNKNMDIMSTSISNIIITITTMVMSFMKNGGSMVVTRGSIMVMRRGIIMVNVIINITTTMILDITMVAVVVVEVEVVEVEAVEVVRVVEVEVTEAEVVGVDVDLEVVKSLQY